MSLYLVVFAFILVSLLTNLLVFYLVKYKLLCLSNGIFGLSFSVFFFSWDYWSVNYSANVQGKRQLISRLIWFKTHWAFVGNLMECPQIERSCIKVFDFAISREDKCVVSCFMFKTHVKPNKFNKPVKLSMRFVLMFGL